MGGLSAHQAQHILELFQAQLALAHCKLDGDGIRRCQGGGKEAFADLIS